MPSLVAEAKKRAGKSFTVRDGGDKGVILGTVKLKGYMALSDVHFVYEEDSEAKPIDLNKIVLRFRSIFTTVKDEVNTLYIEFLNIKSEKKYLESNLKSLINWIGKLSNVKEVTLTEEVFTKDFWENLVGTVIKVDCTTRREKATSEKYWVNVTNTGFNLIADDVPDSFSKYENEITAVKDFINEEMASSGEDSDSDDEDDESDEHNLEDDEDSLKSEDEDIDF